MKEYNWEKLHVPMDSEAPRPQGGASRKGNLIYIVPLDPPIPLWRDGALAGQLGESPFVIFHKEG
jgi:hypothetical protein